MKMDGSTDCNSVLFLYKKFFPYVWAIHGRKRPNHTDFSTMFQSFQTYREVWLHILQLFSWIFQKSVQGHLAVAASHLTKKEVYFLILFYL